MNDETGRTPDRASQGPTPNRGRGRSPTVIDARPVSSQTAAASEPTVEATPDAPSSPVSDASSDALAAALAQASGASATPDIAPGSQPDAEVLPPAEPAREPPVEPAAAEATGPVPAARTPLLPVAAASLGAAALGALAVYLLLPAAPGVDPQTLVKLDQRASALESRMDAAPKAPAPNADVERRLAAAEAQVRSAAEQARAALGQAEKALAQSAPASGAAPLGARLDALEKALAAKPAGDAGPALASLEGRLREIERSLEAPKADARATETRLEPAAPAQPPVDLAPLEKRLADLEAKVSPLDGRIAPLAGAVAELRAAGEAAAANAAQAQAQAASDAKARSEAQSQLALVSAQALVAQAALARLDAGEAFAQEADALAGLGVPAPQVEPLRASAKGVPTIPALSREFSALEPKLRAPAAAPSDASVLDRLTQSAASLVRVRPVGEPSGDSQSDLTARIERALSARDVAGALAAWDKLPEAAKAASADWAGRARARLGAEQSLRAIVSDAIARLGKSKT